MLLLILSLHAVQYSTYHAGFLVIVRYGENGDGWRCRVDYHGCTLTEDPDGTSIEAYDRLKNDGLMLLQGLSRIVDRVEEPGLDYVGEHEMISLRDQVEDPRSPAQRLRADCIESYRDCRSASSNVLAYSLERLSDAV